jgi:hypothetical protein
MDAATLSILQLVNPEVRQDFSRAAVTLGKAGHHQAAHLPILIRACGAGTGQTAWLPRVTGWLVSILDAVRRGGGDPGTVKAAARGLQDPYWLLEILTTLRETGAIGDADVPEAVAALGTALRSPLPAPVRDAHRESFRQILLRTCERGLFPREGAGRAITAIDAIDCWRKHALESDDIGAVDSVLLLLADKPAAGAERLAAFHRAMVTAHAGHRAGLRKVLSGTIGTGEQAGKTERAIAETVCRTRSRRLKLLTTLLSAAWSGRVAPASVREACVLIRRLPGEESEVAELWRRLLHDAGDDDPSGSGSTAALRRTVKVLGEGGVSAGQLRNVADQSRKVPLDPDRLVAAAKAAVAAKRRHLAPYQVATLISKTWLTQEVLPATGEKGLDLIAAVADRMRRHGLAHGGDFPARIEETCRRLSSYISVANPTPFILDTITPRCLAIGELCLTLPPIVDAMMNAGITERAREALGKILDEMLEATLAFGGDPDEVLRMLSSAAAQAGVIAPEEMRALARNIRAMPDHEADTVDQAVEELCVANRTIEDLGVALELQWQIIDRGLYPTRKMLVQLHAAPEGPAQV